MDNLKSTVSNKDTHGKVSPFPFTNLKKLLHGVRKGELLIIASGSGGRSTFGTEPLETK